MLISVIMSVYNAERHLSASILSILNQTYNNFEFIIINDGSTDKTQRILENYKKKDKRIKLINQKNFGLTRSLNKAIKISKGPIIARQDADDVSVSIRLEEQIKWIVNKNFDLVCSRAWDMDKNRVSPRIFYYLPKKLLINFLNPFIHGSFMFKKKSILEIGCYDERFKYAQDFALIHELYKKNKKIKYIKEPLYKLFHPKSSISKSKGFEQKEYVKRLTLF